MNDAQIWTLLGVFAAIMLGGMTLMTTLLTRTLNAAIGGVNSRIDGLEGNLNGRIDGVHARIDGLSGEMRASFTAVDARFEVLRGHRSDCIDQPSRRPQLSRHVEEGLG